MVPGTEAMPEPGAKAERSFGPLFEPLCQSDREKSFRVDALLQLAESGHPHQLVQLLLRAPAHDPGRASAMAGESARNELNLRMPGLAGVNQASPGFDRACQTGERFQHSIVFREELEETRDDPDGRLWPQGN